MEKYEDFIERRQAEKELPAKLDNSPTGNYERAARDAERLDEQEFNGFMQYSGWTYSSEVERKGEIAREYIDKCAKENLEIAKKERRRKEAWKEHTKAINEPYFPDDRIQGND